MHSEEMSRWLAEGLKALMAAPHVLPEEDEEATGHTHADLFSAKFDEMFMPDARGWVCGERADREELKESLIGLQRRWNEKEAMCKGCEPQGMYQVEFQVSDFSGEGTRWLEC